MKTREELLAENQRLRQRIFQLEEKLRRNLAQIPPAQAADSDKDGQKLSSQTAGDGQSGQQFYGNRTAELERRLGIFRSLFRGREDVFARRWVSKSTSKSGYQPVCLNDGYNSPFCNSPKRCDTCPNRSLKALDNDDLWNHLTGKDELGRDVIGLYPILEDNTCFFICADFDDKNCTHGYKGDVLSYVATCEEWDIPAYIERSRSGKGAHVWIFFSEPVPAARARALGFAILNAAMEKTGKLEMESYDRFFPNQDYLPKGGFGNLVALPLQGRARKDGNSVFVDKAFEVIRNQWDYLASAKKLTNADAEALLAQHGHSLKLSSSSESKPWEIPSSSNVSFEDFCGTVHLVRANGIYIPLKGMSGKAIAHLKRLASFANPLYYKLLHARKPLYNTPSIISCYEMLDDYIRLPRGCEDAVTELLQGNFTNGEIDDRTDAGRRIDVSFNGFLRPEQDKAVEALSTHDNGVLSATTAFGKTVAAIALIARLKLNTLILVPSRALMEQWKRELEKFLTISEPEPEYPTGKRGRRKSWSPVGLLDGTRNSLSGIIDVTVYNSLLAGDGIKPFAHGYGIVIADECQHVGAAGFEQVLKSLTAKRVYGLSATPTREDGMTPIVFMQCGPIRFTSDAKAQIARQSFERVLVPRFTTFRSLRGESSPLHYYSELACDRARNELIANDIADAVKAGFTPLALTKRKDHVDILAGMLSGRCANVIRMTGTASAKEKRESMERLRSIPDGESLVVVATGKYLGEGFDYPRFDALFVAMPVAYSNVIQQYTGRLHRDYEGKRIVKVYDYIDIHVPALTDMYGKRLKSYAPIGYSQQVDEALEANPEGIIFGADTYLPVLAEDIASAKESVVLSCGQLQFTKAPLAEALQTLCLRGVRCRMMVRQPSERDAKFISAGIDVQVSGHALGCAVVIDRELLWYGNLDFTSGYHRSRDNAMRIRSAAIASEMIGVLLDGN